MDDSTFEHGGKRYSLTLNRGEAPTGGPASTPSMVWHLTLGPTALTTFPAIVGETVAEARARVIAWIDAHPDLQDRDQIVLGGG